MGPVISCIFFIVMVRLNGKSDDNKSNRTKEVGNADGHAEGRPCNQMI